MVVGQISPGFCAGGASLVPFATIAFIWFIGALRDPVNDGEDRLFATVFQGSTLDGANWADW